MSSIRGYRIGSRARDNRGSCLSAAKRERMGYGQARESRPGSYQGTIKKERGGGQVTYERADELLDYLEERERVYEARLTWKINE